nr:helix-turn-helix transcriptional regulator [Azospirillum soli]
MTTPEPVAADAPKPAARPRGRKGKAGPDVIDVHVGQRLRIARTLRGLSQGDLGAAIGLTFQQIQKYERGSNRISAGTLFRLGNALDVPVSYFFDGAGEAGPNVAAGLDGVADRGALRTASAIQRVPNAGVRDALSALVQALADAGNADESGAVKD